MQNQPTETKQEYIHRMHSRNISLIPNCFPEVTFGEFDQQLKEKLLTELRKEMTNCDCWVSTNTIAACGKGTDDYPDIHKLQTVINSVLSNHDIDPIEYRIREITIKADEELEFHNILYYTLFTINP